MDTEYGKSKIALNTLVLSIKAGFHLNVGGLCDFLTNTGKAVPVFRPRPKDTYIFPFLSLGNTATTVHCGEPRGVPNGEELRLSDQMPWVSNLLTTSIILPARLSVILGLDPVQVEQVW